MYVYVYAHMCVYMCVYIYIYIYTYTHLYVYLLYPNLSYTHLIQCIIISIIRGGAGVGRVRGLRGGHGAASWRLLYVYIYIYVYYM